mmetsp:Transcript_16436/g.57433  ORF Transcript_16436/g.57433 Transcript_16436/m.57433 type:complete len:437 (+) Transcript_16436:1250-2560(+)
MRSGVLAPPVLSSVPSKDPSASSPRLPPDAAAAADSAVASAPGPSTTAATASTSCAMAASTEVCSDDDDSARGGRIGVGIAMPALVASALDLRSGRGGDDIWPADGRRRRRDCALFNDDGGGESPITTVGDDAPRAAADVESSAAESAAASRTSAFRRIARLRVPGRDNRPSESDRRDPTRCRPMSVVGALASVRTPPHVQADWLCSSLRSRATSRRARASSTVSSTTSLARTLTMICRARSANAIVEADSSAAAADGDTVATMIVLVLPPSESCSSRVSAESRYGMCARRFSVSAWMQLPSADSDLLIAVSSLVRPASSRRDVSHFSLPARSTRLSFARRITLRLAPGLRVSTVTLSCRIAWLRDDASLYSVPRTARFRPPVCSRNSTSSALLTRYSARFCTYTSACLRLALAVSRMMSGRRRFRSCRRSYSFSL